MNFRNDDDISRMEVANNAAYSIAKALEHQKGAVCEVIYYPFYTRIKPGQSWDSFDQSDIQNFCAKGFEQRVSSVKGNFRMTPEFDTPTASAISGALTSLSQRKEERKVLFLLTDGDCNSNQDVSSTLAECDVLNIDVVGVGISMTMLDGFEDRPFFVISSAEELADAMFGYLKEHYR